MHVKATILRQVVQLIERWSAETFKQVVLDSRACKGRGQAKTFGRVGFRSGGLAHDKPCVDLLVNADSYVFTGRSTSLDKALLGDTFCIWDDPGSNVCLASSGRLPKKRTACNDVRFCALVQLGYSSLAPNGGSS